MRLELQQKKPLKCPSFSHTDCCVCVFFFAPPIVQDKGSLWWSWSCLSVSLSELARLTGRSSCTVSPQYSLINSQHPQWICPPPPPPSSERLLALVHYLLPPQRTKHWTRGGAVSVAKPTFWNSAPLNLHDSSDLAMFKRLRLTSSAALLLLLYFIFIFYCCSFFLFKCF